EERRAAGIRRVVGNHAIRQPHGRTRVALLLLTLDGGVGVAALLAFERSYDTAVAPIDVLADLELAGVIDARGLVGDVDRDRRRQLNVLLGIAVHTLDALGRIAIIRPRDRQQDFGVLRRILHAHAAVAVGAPVMREQVLVRRVVLIHQELVGEVEA